MKTAERRHLKENEVQRWVRETSELIDQRRREVTALVIVVVVVGGGALGWYAWHSRTQARAHALLADAMTVDQARVAPPAAPGAPLPPGTFPTERARAEAALAKSKAAADAYPSTDAGIFARYQQAATLMT